MIDEMRDSGEKMILGRRREEEALEILGTRNAKKIWTSNYLMLY